MDASQFANADEAIDAARANLSPRQIELENLERFARGTQYEGRKNWFDDSVPLWERAPCIVYPVVDIAIESNADLVLGESRFPVVTSNPGENDAEAGGLDAQQSRKVDRAIREVLDRVRFRAVSRQALKHAEEAKSVAVIAGVRNKRPFLELVRSRWCEPTFNADGCVEKLEIRYPYLKPEKQQDGKWRLKALLYRRIIDDKSDTTYLPVEARRDGVEPPASAWAPDKTNTVDHKLGFCPVHWYPHMKECSTVADYDGEAIHENILDEIEGLDFALSQRHSSALFCGDPQIVETGVAPGYNPSGQVGKTAIPSTAAGGKPSASNPVTGHYVPSEGKPARRKSPGVVWQYEDQNVKVAYLVLPPGALEALDGHAADLRNKVAEALAVVLIDPQNAKFTSDMSGRAIEQLRSRQFDRCDQIRDDVGDNWILPVVKLLLRVALATKIALKAIEPVRDILEKFIDDAESAPMLFLRWPSSYMRPQPEDETATVTTTGLALQAKIITRRMAVQKVAPIYGVDDVDQAMEALEKEDQENAAKALEQQKAQTALGGGPAAKPGAPGAKPAEGGEPPKPGGQHGALAAGPAKPVVAPPAPPAGAQAAEPVAEPTKPAALAAKPTTAAAGPGISQAGASTSGVTESVYAQLLEDFPPEAIAWVRAAPWTGPGEVPLDEIDFSNAAEWQATDEPERVQFFVDRIQAGNRKPIILVNEPNNEKLIVIDGHHRLLAYQQLGEPVNAYVAHVTSVSGPWDEMHAAVGSSRVDLQACKLEYSIVSPK